MPPVKVGPVPPRRPPRARRRGRLWRLQSWTLGALPPVNHFLDRLGLDALLARYVPRTDRRCRLAPAAALGVLVRNVLLGRAPVYGLEEWAAPFEPALGVSKEVHQLPAMGRDQVVTHRSRPERTASRRHGEIRATAMALSRRAHALSLTALADSARPRGSVARSIRARRGPRQSAEGLLGRVRSYDFRWGPFAAGAEGARDGSARGGRARSAASGREPRPSGRCWSGGP